MGAKSTIEWCDATWNPVRGCSMAKGSEAGGRLNCYAARLMARGLPGLLSADGKPLARIMDSGPRWTGKVELVEKALTLPLKWRKPKRIFVNSLSDLFHEALTDEQIDRVFAVMALCPHHTFQILTKRPERMVKYIGESYSGNRGNGVYPESHARRRIERLAPSSGHENAREAGYENRKWPLPNIWLGVSVENQATSDARIPLLLQTPAAKRFVSYEPALGPGDFSRWLPSPCYSSGNTTPTGRESGLSQIIVGGESGPKARPFDIQWARNTIAQCRAAGIACFVKQLGARPAYRTTVASDPPIPLGLGDRKGGLMEEWPEDLRVQEFPA